MMKTAKKRTRMRIRKGKRIIKGKTIRKKIWKWIRKSILKPKLAPNQEENLEADQEEHPETQTGPKPPSNSPKTAH